MYAIKYFSLEIHLASVHMLKIDEFKLIMVDDSRSRAGMNMSGAINTRRTIGSLNSKVFSRFETKNLTVKVSNINENRSNLDSQERTNNWNLKTSCKGS